MMEMVGQIPVIGSLEKVRNGMTQIGTDTGIIQLGSNLMAV